MSRKHYLIVGLGKFGMSVAKKLSEYDCEILAIDNNMSLVEEASEYVTHAIQVNVNDPSSLLSLSLNSFDTAIVGIGSNLESSIMSCILLQEAGIPKIIAKAKNNIHKKILEKLGISIVLLPEEEMGERLAKSLSHNIIESIQFSSDYSMIEIAPYKEWINKSISELDLRTKYGINIICINRKDAQVSVLPAADDIILEEDIIIAIVESKKWEKYK